MLGLPKASVFEMRVPKNKIIETLPPRSRLKRLVTEQIDAIHWRHALSEESTRLPAGKTVREIDVLEIVVRTPTLDRDVALAVDSVFPRPTILVITTPLERRLAMGYKEIRARADRTPKAEILAFFSTPLPDPDAPAIRLEGYDLDAARDNFLRQIAGDVAISTGMSNSIPFLDRSRSSTTFSSPCSVPNVCEKTSGRSSGIPSFSLTRGAPRWSIVSAHLLNIWSRVASSSTATASPFGPMAAEFWLR